MRAQLCDLSALSLAPSRTEPTGMQPGEAVRAELDSLRVRAHRRLFVLSQVRDNMDPPLNRDDPDIVRAYNHLRLHVDTLPNGMFSQGVRDLLRANYQSLRPVQNVYVDDFLDEMGVPPGPMRALAEDLLLKRVPIAHTDPAATLQQLYAIIGQEKLKGWKDELLASKPNARVRWHPYRNPYKPDNMSATLNL